MSQPSPDAKAVVRAAEALTTQVRRIADALSTPVVRYEVATDDGATTTGDDDTTTAATECSAQYHADGYDTQCIRAAQHPGLHVDTKGFSWPELYAVYPLDPGAVKASVPLPRPVEVIEDERALREYLDTLQVAARRDSLLNLLDRLDRHTTLTAEERALLRRQVLDEGTDSDRMRSWAWGLLHKARQLRAGRETWKRKAEEMERARDEEERLRLALAEERDRWKARAEEVAIDMGRDLLRDGLDAFLMRLVGSDNTARLLGERDQARDAVERLGAELDYWSRNTLEPQTARALDDLRRALNGTGKPTPKAAAKLPRLGTTEGT